jgi:dienelactone hydrolase
VTNVLLFHHAQGLTAGIVSFADELRAAGHTVHVPDFYGGRTYATLEDGMAYAEEIGLKKILERNVRNADELSTDLVYAGFSLGEMAAQKLAQNPARGSRRSALLLLYPDHGRLGLRPLARRRSGADPRDGLGSDLRRRGRS